MDYSPPGFFVHGISNPLSGLPFPYPEDFPELGIKFLSPALAGDFFTTESPGKTFSHVMGTLQYFMSICFVTEIC